MKHTVVVQMQDPDAEIKTYIAQVTIDREYFGVAVNQAGAIESCLLAASQFGHSSNPDDYAIDYK